MKERFDLVIVGAGPAGLAAARAAAASGMRIALVDDNARAGGQVWRQGPSTVVPEALRDALSHFIGSPNVVHYAGARVASLTSEREMMVDLPSLGGLSISLGKLIIATPSFAEATATSPSRANVSHADMDSCRTFRWRRR